MSAQSNIDAGVAPPAYQAEAVRRQVTTDLDRRFWRARQRLLKAFDEHKAEVERDHQSLDPEAFLAKYDGWRFL